MLIFGKQILIVLVFEGSQDLPLFLQKNSNGGVLTVESIRNEVDTEKQLQIGIDDGFSTVLFSYCRHLRVFIIVKYTSNAIIRVLH